MEFRNILVVLDYTSSCNARLELATRLAGQHSARLSGLYVVSHGFFESKKNEAASHADQVQSAFIEATGRAGIDARWIGADESVIGASAAEIVNRHAYYYDLVVVGQDEPEIYGRDSLADPHAGLPLRCISLRRACHRRRPRPSRFAPSPFPRGATRRLSQPDRHRAGAMARAAGGVVGVRDPGGPCLQG